MDAASLRKVLIADDDPTSLYYLHRLMEGWGYEVWTARDGTATWGALRAPDAPPLLILDWMMPGMDGTEICERLAQDPDGQSVYVILVSAKNTSGDRLTALDAGAHDYMTKPYDLKHMERRVAVAQRIIDERDLIRTQREQLREHARKMEVLAAGRARQLLHADRLATLGTLSAGMAHEIINPVSMMSASTQSLVMLWARIKPVITGSLPDEGWTLMLDEVGQSVGHMQKGITRVIRLVNNMRSFARKDPESMAACNVNELVDMALELSHARLCRDITVEKQLASPPPFIHGIGQQIEQVLVNVFLNAADAMINCKLQILRITTSATRGQVQIRIEDTGPGIPTDLLESIWEPFFTTKEGDRGTGLGLSIARKTISEHGGTISAGNRSEGGAVFHIELPAATDPVE